jgi:uncharacterized protein YigE (DUF2233 family)
VRRVLHARYLLPFVLVVAVFALWRNTRALHWRPAGAGAEFTLFSGEPLCRMGSSAIAVLRVDPARVRVRVRYYDRMRPARMLSILEWQKATGAHAVFNAGQFYPDFRYMGVLVCAGDTVSARQHSGFQAALVARKGRAAVLDLASQSLASQGAWSDVAQSFMLFDRKGGVRVRRTDRIANRTAVGVDERGWLVVCVSEGAYTLADYAQVLMRSPLKLTHAMSMDGGLESELVVKVPGLRYASFGDWSPDREPTAPGAVVPLPAVITLEMR